MVSIRVIYVINCSALSSTSSFPPSSIRAAVTKHLCCGSAENDCEDVVVDDKDMDGGTTALQHRLFVKGWQLVHR